MYKRQEEYRLNRRIKLYPKPYLALVGGIVMGGGAGLSLHGSHVVAGENFTFAMPEAGIGFFPDVGATFFLPRLPLHAGVYLALTGARMSCGDALTFGVAGAHVPLARHAGLAQRLIGGEAIAAAIAAESVPPPASCLLYTSPTLMLAFYARLLFTAAIALTLTEFDPSLRMASATQAATANAAPPPQAKPNLTKGISLVSHRAVYELTLAKSVGSKSPTAAHGRIAFDFTGSVCDGYVQNFRQLTELQPAEGPTRVSDMHSATYEDADGRSFDFKMQTSIDSNSAESVDRCV